jgi:hypothetical protein
MGNKSDQQKEKGKRSVTFRDDPDPHNHHQHHSTNSQGADDRLTMAMDNLAATIVNAQANKESAIQSDSWAFKAVKLASSLSKSEPAEQVAKGPRAVAKNGDRDARDTIAQDIIQRRQANFRIDKTMAANIRSFKVFRLSPELTGNMSIYHCYPRPTFELQDIISGEELESKVKTKAISGKIVSGYYESKLGIAESATLFTEQMFNFWQYNAFMFGDEAWLTHQIKQLYEICQALHRPLQSIVDIDKDYILKLSGKINNDYHLFLSSCIEADGDIDEVEWSFVEDLPKTVANIIKTRSPPGYIINTLISRIADQTRAETKRKLMAEGILNHTGLTPPRKQRQAERRKNRNNKESDDDDDEREEDPSRLNPNVDPKWRMSGNEFRRVISPHAKKDCPKVGNQQVCAMFHILGRCGFGSKCHNFHDELPGAVHDEMDKWIKHCKEGAKKDGKKGAQKKKRDD